MKKVFFCLMVSLLMPSMALAVSNSANENGNGSSGSNTVNSSTVTSQGNSTATDTASTNAGSQTQSENRIQTQTSNPGVGTMTQEQTEAKIQEQITESKPEYSPRNEKATERMSKVAVAAEQLIRVSNRIENQGIGDQIREAAQTQTKNQDKIN